MGIIISADSVGKTYKVLKKDSNKFFIKSYETKTALDEVSFSVEEGEMVGYLGLNGAGKSTTIKILSGILAPTSGNIKVLGMNPLKERKKCAYFTSALFGQKNQLWWDLPVEDSIELVRYMYNMNRDTFKENYRFIDKYLDISEISKTPVRQLSLGQKMRANLCFSLLHDPRVIFLDEPTIGLDLLTKQQVQDCIRVMNREKGISLVLTTHDVSDIESLCKRVILIDKGKLIFDDQLDRLRKDFSAGKGLIVSFESGSNDKEIEAFLNQNNVSYEINGDNEFIIDVLQKGFMNSNLFEVLKSKFSVVGISNIDDSLKTVLTKIYKELDSK